MAPLEARFGAIGEDLASTAMHRYAAMELDGDPAALELEDEADDAPFAVWRIAFGLGVDDHRRHQTARKYAPQLVAAAASPSAEDVVLDRELGLLASAAVAALPKDRREALHGVAEGLTAEDIAARLGKSVYAVKHLIARARAQVRAELRDAELAIGAWWARRRRSPDSVAGGVAWSAAIPSLALALSIAAPVICQAVTYATEMLGARSSREIVATRLMTNEFASSEVALRLSSSSLRLTTRSAEAPPVVAMPALLPCTRGCRRRSRWTRPSGVPRSRDSPTAYR